jgi:hypothetical protein
MNFSDKIQDLNDAMPQAPNKNNANVLGAFGGQSQNFARGVAEQYAEQFYVEGAEPDAFTVPTQLQDKVIAKSIANSYALFNYQGFNGSLGSSAKNFYTDQEDNPLMGGDQAHNVSLPKIIEFFQTNYPKINYKPADFLYSKYYKKIPVNHLVTLRRFPTPIPDNIYDLQQSQAQKPDSSGAAGKPKEIGETIFTSGVTAITYLGETAGNTLEDLLTMSFGTNWKEIESEMEAISSGDGGYTSQPFYSKIGAIGRATADAAQGISSGDKFRKGLNSTDDRFGTTYANFVLGPVNVVDKTNIRDRGLKFQNDMKLKFEYELKSLSYVNPKIAMIDVMSNMLTMCTNNAQFFGGGHRYYGSAGAIANQFGDINKLKGGDFSGYMGSVVQDVETGFSNLFGTGDGGFDANSILDGVKNVGKTMLGNVLGGFLSSNVGAVSGTQATKAFISGEPTGNWHLTVGNPLNPIVMMGNMICDNATMTLGQGLGYDDFPMEVSFELDIKHGKPRDKGDIENMFNAGRGRIYASAKGIKDILNLKGLEVQTYGSKPDAGTSNIQPNANSGAATSSVNNENISNTNSNQSDAIASNSGNADYVSNLTSMMIDS